MSRRRELLKRNTKPVSMAAIMDQRMERPLVECKSARETRQQNHKKDFDYNFAALPKAAGSRAVRRGLARSAARG